MKLNQLVRIITISQRKWCHNSKHFAELDPHHSGKTARVHCGMKKSRHYHHMYKSMFTIIQGTDYNLKFSEIFFDVGYSYVRLCLFGVQIEHNVVYSWLRLQNSSHARALVYSFRVSHFSTPESWSHIFQSSIFRCCNLDGLALSIPAFSVDHA